MGRRDIDLIIERLTTDLPTIQVQQLQVLHPGSDDDGIWFFTISGRDGQVQLESSAGVCPFIVESDFDNERVEVHTVEEAIAVVRRCLE